MFTHQEKVKERRFFRDTFESIWNFWTSPTGAFILAVSAIALGYYQFYISRPILRYETNTVKLISSSNTNEYAVDVKGKKYKDLYLTRSICIIRENRPCQELTFLISGMILSGLKFRKRRLCNIIILTMMKRLMP